MYRINNIKQLQQSGTAALNILKDQTRVIKKVVVEAEQNYRDMVFLQTKIYDFMQADRASTDFLRNHTMALEHKTRVQDMYLLLNLLLNQYAFETNYLSEMINVARLGQIHPGIISIEILRESMKEIKL